MKSYSLHQLNSFVRQAIALNFDEPIWVKAEIAQSNFSGRHLFLTLIQKEENGEVLAQSEAICWNTDWLKLSRQKRDVIDSSEGHSWEVLWLVEVHMHERYGLKLRIIDLDPQYALGQLERQRLETIQSLERLGLMELNKRIPAASVFQRIAVFSSSKAAGYQDFMDELQGNIYGYSFETVLFEVAVQGQLVYSDFERQMRKLEMEVDQFDCVVVIRGGGSKMDLVEFDQFELVSLLAKTPLPLVTGIGHERDTSVADMVAYQALKTPTAVASWLVNRMAAFEQDLIQQKEYVLEKLRYLVQQKKQNLDRTRFELQSHLEKAIWKMKSDIEYKHQTVYYLLKQYFQAQHTLLEKATLETKAYHPELVLSKGYFLAEDMEGQPLKTIEAIRRNENIRLRQSEDSIHLKKV